MRRSIAILAAVLLCSSGAWSQAGFECAPTGPLPLDPASSCEGLASNNLVATTGVTSTPSCGFPTVGLQYCTIVSNGPLSSPPGGGPIPRPIPPLASEVRIPIPGGATALSFDWDFFNSEGPGSTVFNDGMSIDVVGPSGALIGNLVYADTFTPAGSCFHVNGGTECAPAGLPQTFSGLLPAHSPCDYISIAVWNAGDNAVAGRGCVDNFVFDTAFTGCAVPCFGVTPALSFSSPGGPGCLLVNLSGLPSGGIYFLAATLNPPPGWFFGINISFAELSNEINVGPPFSGPLSSTACSGAATVGQFCLLPSGLTIYAVGLGLPGPTLSSYVTANTPAVSYTIP